MQIGLQAPMQHCGHAALHKVCTVIPDVTGQYIRASEGQATHPGQASICIEDMGNIVAGASERDAHLQPVPALLHRQYLCSAQPVCCCRRLIKLDRVLAVRNEYLLYLAKQVLKFGISSPYNAQKPETSSARYMPYHYHRRLNVACLAVAHY